MAVVVQCFHCNAVLELDEGFRGGVCRCSGCGSLLQVPRGERDPKAPRRVRPAGPPAPTPGNNAAPASGADPRSPRPSANRPPSMDASGLSSGLRQVHKTRPITAHSRRSDGKTELAVAAPEPPAAPPPLLPSSTRDVQPRNRLLWTALALVALIAAIIVVLVMMFMVEDDPATLPVAPASTPAAVPAREASFAGIPLTGRRILLSVDGSVSMTDGFDYLRRGILRTTHRLAPNQPMLVVLWTEDGLRQVPASGFGQGGDAWHKELQDQLAAFSPQGSSDAGKSMRATLELAGPGDQVFFVTAKNSLPLAMAEGVLEARKENVRIDGIRLATQETPDLLEHLAKQTTGQYLFMTFSELDQATR